MEEWGCLGILHTQSPGRVIVSNINIRRQLKTGRECSTKIAGTVFKKTTTVTFLE